MGRRRKRAPRGGAARAGIGGLAPTPDLNRPQPGRKRVSSPTFPTREKEGLPRPARPGAHKSGSGRQLPTQPAELGFPPALVAEAEAEAGGERPRARHLPLRAGSEGAGPDHRPTPRARGWASARKGTGRGAKADWGRSSGVPESGRGRGLPTPPGHAHSPGTAAPSPAHSADSFPDPAAPARTRASRPTGDPWTGRG